MINLISLLKNTKSDDEDFENFTKYWICDNDYADDDVKVRDHCHIIGRGSAIETAVVVQFY